MKILIMHQTITSHDAIGNDIESMFRILSQKYECYCYAENQFHTGMVYICDDELQMSLSNAENLVIYHHSLYWEKGENLLKGCNARIVFRYHNITPPDFFKVYNSHYMQQCENGRLQTERFQKKFPNAFWISDSIYNSLDLKFVAENRLGICAPFNKAEEWGKTKPDEKLLEELLYSQTTNLLFVGRIVPNKGHLDLIDSLYQYCSNFDNNIRLRIIGKFDDGLAGYNRELISRIDSYGIQRHIEFIGEVTDSTLLSYYLGSDIFVCASAHEGFCVPVIEAQYFKLPVITVDSSALMETIGPNQICIKRNVMDIAAAIRTVSTNIKYQSFLRNCGYQNFINRFSINRTTKIFSNILSERLNIFI